MARPEALLEAARFAHLCKQTRRKGDVQIWRNMKEQEKFRFGIVLDSLRYLGSTDMHVLRLKLGCLEGHTLFVYKWRAWLKLCELGKIAYFLT